MKYKLYNKTRFLKNDEVVIDQEGSILVLDDGDAPNHIRNCLDVDILKATDEKDIHYKQIIEGDIIISKHGCYVVDYHNSSFVIVDLVQQVDGNTYYQDRHFGNTFSWMKGDVEIVANIYENERMKRYYKKITATAYQRN